MGDLERKRKEFFEKLKDNKDKLEDFYSTQTNCFLEELEDMELDTEEDIDTANAVLQFALDQIELDDDVKHEKIDSTEFYKNQGIQYIVKYINALKEGSDVEEVLEDLEDPSLAAEVFYGLAVLPAYIEIANVYIRLKTGFDFDLEDDELQNMEYLDYFMVAYNRISKETPISKDCSLDDKMEFCETFHEKHVEEKIANRLIDSLMGLVGIIKEQVEEYENEKKKDARTIEIVEDKKSIEEYENLLFLPRNVVPSLHAWSASGFTIIPDVRIRRTEEKYYAFQLPANWTTKKDDDKTLLIDENSNIRGYINKEEAVLKTRYNIQLETKDDKREVIYFGEDNKRLYEIIVKNPSNDRMRLGIATVRQWAYENYPEWENVTAYWDNEKNKGDEPKK